MNYLKKMNGAGKSPARPPAIEILWSWLGAFLGISAVSYAHYNLLDNCAFSNSHKIWYHH